MNEVNDNDKIFIIALFETVIQMHFDSFKFKFDKYKNINDILNKIDKKYNINNFLSQEKKETLNLNLEIFLKNKFDEKEIPLWLINFEYKDNLNTDFLLIETMYFKYDLNYNNFIVKLFFNIINYILTLQFIGFSNLNNLKNKKYLDVSNLHKYYLFDFKIYSKEYEYSLSKFNKNIKKFTKEEFKLNYMIDSKNVNINILSTHLTNNDIINLLKNDKINITKIKTRNRIWSEETSFGDKRKYRRNRNSNNEFELNEYMSNGKKDISMSLVPPFMLQSEDLLKTYKKNSMKDLDSDSEKDEEYSLVSLKNRDELGISFSKKSKTENSNNTNNINKILRENSGNISLGNDWDSFFSFVKYSKFKLSDLFKEYHTNNKDIFDDKKVIFRFGSIFNHENLDELMDELN